uniref:C2H2-type domain-containing protein n=1 Tax=Oryza brachyantha TaxID=4533 RepID=J3MXJ7_ORYBR
MELPSRGTADAPPPHGDPMAVVRDALLSQLQHDRLRQEVIVAELAKIELAMALRDASPSPSPPSHGAAANETIQPKKPSSSEESEAAVQKPMQPSAWICNVCEVRATSERNLRDHHGGKKHKSKVAALVKSRTKAMARQKAKTTAKPSPAAGQKIHRNSRWSCSICQVNCNGEWHFDTHLKGKRHQANTQALLEQSKKNSHGTKVQPSIVVSASSETMDEQKALYFCKVCSLKCTSERMLSDHLRGKKHLKQEELMAFCEVCNLQCSSGKVLADHRYGKKHRAKLNEMK